jgi:excisionase family DNA binding protein
MRFVEVMNAMFTVNELAAMLKVSRSTLYNAVESGELPHHRIGRGRGTIRISEEQYQRFLERTKVEEPSTSGRLQDIKFAGK